MKRFLIWIILVMAVFAVPVSAREAAPYANAGELYQHWTEAGIPDYISGVWSTDGGMDNLTFGIVMGYEKMADILYAQIQADDSLTVVYQAYSWKELTDIQKAMEPYMQQEYGFVSLGVDLYENALILEIHTDYRENARTQALVEDLCTEYGNCLIIRYVDRYPQLTYDQKPAGHDGFWIPGQTGDMYVLFVLVGGALLLTVVCGALLRRQQGRVMVIAEGTAVVGAYKRRVSRRDVKVLLNGHQPLFPEGLDSRMKASMAVQENSIHPHMMTD